MMRVPVPCLLVLALTACQPAVVGSAADGSPTGAGGGDGGGDAGGDGGDGGDGNSGDGGGWDTAIEQVPGGTESAPALCQVSLDCPSSIPSEDKLLCAMGIRGGPGESTYDGHAGVELRGRSSSQAPKPGYSVELRTAEGAEAPTNLFGMGSDADWVLDGLYYDRSFVRDALAYDLFRAMGDTVEGVRYAPEYRFCELTLDGDLRGVYALVERVKRDDDRIDIPADDGTGQSFVLKQDDQAGVYPLSMAYGHLRLLHPDPDTITGAQETGVTSWLSGWETAVLGGDPGNPDTGIFTFLDLDSTVDLVLLQEVLKNNDAWFLSLHLWKAPGGRIFWTPWDLDLTLGQPNYNENYRHDTWVAYRPDMVQSMANVPAFHSRLAERWAELRQTVFSDEAVLGRIDVYQETLGPAIDRNYAIWDITEVVFLDPSYLYPVANYTEEDAAIRQWIVRRFDWVDDNIDGF